MNLYIIVKLPIFHHKETPFSNLDENLKVTNDNLANENLANQSFSWTMSEKQRTNYSNIFKLIDKNQVGWIDEVEAKPFFSKSGLIASELTKIWNLSDQTSDGKLDEKEFKIALFLIQARMEGQNLPYTIPSSLLESLCTDFLIFY